MNEGLGKNGIQIIGRGQHDYCNWDSFRKEAAKTGYAVLTFSSINHGGRKMSGAVPAPDIY